MADAALEGARRCGSGSTVRVNSEGDGDDSAADVAAGGPFDGGVVLQPEGGDRCSQVVMATLHLHSGEVRAEAAVDADTEREVAVWLAIDDELVGVRELGWVAVGGRER